MASLTRCTHSYRGTKGPSSQELGPDTGLPIGLEANLVEMGRGNGGFISPLGFGESQALVGRSKGDDSPHFLRRLCEEPGGRRRLFSPMACNFMI